MYILGKIRQDLYKINDTLNRLTEKKKEQNAMGIPKNEILDDGIRKGIMEEAFLSIILLSGTRYRKKDGNVKILQDRKV